MHCRLWRILAAICRDSPAQGMLAPGTQRPFPHLGPSIPPSMELAIALSLLASPEGWGG